MDDVRQKVIREIEVGNLFNAAAMIEEMESGRKKEALSVRLVKATIADNELEMTQTLIYNLKNEKTKQKLLVQLARVAIKKNYAADFIYEIVSCINQGKEQDIFLMKLCKIYLQDGAPVKAVEIVEEILDDERKYKVLIAIISITVLELWDYSAKKAVRLIPTDRREALKKEVEQYIIKRLPESGLSLRRLSLKCLEQVFAR